jgi:hypothetical protein
MRAPHVRFRVQPLMIAVAVVATPLGIVEDRRVRFANAARAHKAERASLGLSDLELYLFLTAPQMGQDPPPSAVRAEQERARAALPLLRFMQYHMEMEGKYERASQRPWLYVAFDPPLPPRPSREWLKAYYQRYINISPGLELPDPTRASLRLVLKQLGMDYYVEEGRLIISDRENVEKKLKISENDK